MTTPENDNQQEVNEKLSKDLKGTAKSLRSFLRELLDIRNDTDRDSTIEAVKKDIPFKGHNAWILIFSIFVASIGLNVTVQLLLLVQCLFLL